MTNRDDNTVSVIDVATRSVADAVQVGAFPAQVAFSPDGVYAYVTNRDGGSVSVIAAPIGEVVATMGVGTLPRGIALASAP